MSGFDAAWLTLREPADARARDEAIAADLATALAARQHDAVGRPARIIDLGGGTGANLRWLAPRLGLPQHWTIVDDDPALLDALTQLIPVHTGIEAPAPDRGPEVRVAAGGVDRHPASGPVTFERLELDLSSGIDTLHAAAPDVLTASALLDLVSEQWLKKLADVAARTGALACFALTYDGRISVSPDHPHDARVAELVNRHQRGDKGFGPALGPTAVAAAERIFGRREFRVTRQTSDWRLRAAHAELQTALIDGWREAALDIDAGADAWLRDWVALRRVQCQRGELAIDVGHEDLLAVPVSGPA